MAGPTIPKPEARTNGSTARSRKTSSVPASPGTPSHNCRSPSTSGDPSTTTTDPPGDRDGRGRGPIPTITTPIPRADPTAEERAQASERSRWEEELERLSGELRLLETELEQTKQKEQMAANDFDTARTWAQYDIALADYRRKVARVAERAELQTGQAVTGADVEPLVESARQDAVGSVESARDAEAAARGKRQAISRFIDELSEAEAVCPVCLRSIDPSESEHAIALHREELERLADEVSRHAMIRKEAEQRLAQVEVLRDSLRALQEPHAPVQPLSLPSDEAKEALEAVRNNRDDLRENRSTLRQSIDSLQNQLDQDDEVRQRAHRAERAYRIEAVASVAETTLDGVADEVNRRRLEPLAHELESRWKEFWGGGGGMRLLPSGALSITKGGKEITYDQMSGGEKVIAVLMVQLITVFMTTNSRFLWLDEPLEHLDPRNRRMVASMLVKAAASGQFDQLLVTTYEEPVARRLADQAERATVVYVTSDPVS